jgi:hypothetical protein
MRKPAAILLPTIECMPFAHFYPVLIEPQAEDGAAEAEPAEMAAGEAQPRLGLWERVLELFASVPHPYGSIVM